MDQSNDNDEHEAWKLHDELSWCLTWCDAFPTLIWTGNYCDREMSRIFTLRAWNRALDNNKKQKPSLVPSNETDGSFLPWTNSLGYGEILPETVFVVSDWLEKTLKDDDYRETSLRTDVIVDLGSGNGKALLASALRFPLSQCCYGIEIVPSLHHQALTLLQNSCWKTPSSLVGPRISFCCDDFVRQKQRIQTEGDLLWIHATVFEPELMNEVQSLCEGCRTGTVFVLVSNPLDTTRGIVETLASLPLYMSWGQTSVYIQRRTSI